MTATLAGCARMTVSAGTECLRWEPIAWSVNDTDETIRQVKAHNAVYQSICGKAQ